MIDPVLVRDHIDQVRKGLKDRGVDADAVLDALVELDAARRRLIPELEELKRQQNASGEEVAKAKRQGIDTTSIQEANRARGQTIKQLDVEVDAIEQRRREALLDLPNLPHASVPIGKTDHENVEVRRVGEPRTFGFAPLPHWDLGPALGIIDFERATKIAGARFSI